VVLGLSVLAPLYTYFIYPFVLRLLPQRIYKNVAVENQLSYSIYIASDNYSFNVTGVDGDIIIFTDGESDISKADIHALIKNFSHPEVGCVCGMVRKEPDENGEYHDGANWIYENKIKKLESNIGCLSGGNSALLAVRKVLIPQYYDNRVSWDFFLPTHITELGYDVIFEPDAVAYEREDKSEENLFSKHIGDGASYYRSIAHFWRLLLPRKGSFVFWSHRVLKWLVPFNMIMILAGCAVLASTYTCANVLLILQVLGYLYLTTYYFAFTKRGKSLKGPIGTLSDFGSYFLVLNVAWFLGLFKI
jgi:hypothetical protein